MCREVRVEDRGEDLQQSLLASQIGHSGWCLKSPFHRPRVPTENENCPEGATMISRLGQNLHVYGLPLTRMDLNLGMQLEPRLFVEATGPLIGVTCCHANDPYSTRRELIQYPTNQLHPH